MLTPKVREITRDPRGELSPLLPREDRHEWFDRMRTERIQRELVTASLSAGVPSNVRKNGLGAR